MNTETNELFPYCNQIFGHTVKVLVSCTQKTANATKLSKEREVKGQICSRVPVDGHQKQTFAHTHKTCILSVGVSDAKEPKLQTFLLLTRHIINGL